MILIWLHSDCIVVASQILQVNGLAMTGSAHIASILHPTCFKWNTFCVIFPLNSRSKGFEVRNMCTFVHCAVVVRRLLEFLSHTLSSTATTHIGGAAREWPMVACQTLANWMPIEAQHDAHRMAAVEVPTVPAAWLNISTIDMILTCLFPKIIYLILFNGLWTPRVIPGFMRVKMY